MGEGDGFPGRRSRARDHAASRTSGPAVRCHAQRRVSLGRRRRLVANTERDGGKDPVLVRGHSPDASRHAVRGRRPGQHLSQRRRRRFMISFGDSRVMRIAFNPANPDVMYAVAEINGFLVSENGGETWRGEPEGLLELAKLAHLKSRIETDDDAEGVFDAHSVCTTPADPDA